MYPWMKHLPRKRQIPRSSGWQNITIYVLQKNIFYFLVHLMLKEETLARKFVRKWFWLYFFTFLIGPLGYIIKMIISRDLSVWEVGMIYGVISFISLISAYNDLWCTESLNFFMPKHILKGEFWKAKYLLKLTLIAQGISSVSIALILFFFAPWIANNYFHSSLVADILRIAGLFFIGSNILHITGTIFSVVQDTKLQKLIEFLRMWFTALGAILLFLNKEGTTTSYMWVWVGGVFFSMIFGVLFAYIKYYRTYFTWVRSEVDIAERNHFIWYAWATLLTANIGTILSQIDMQIIIYFLGATATGYYSNYLSLLNIPFILISPIIGFLFPVISELHGREDVPKMYLIHERFSLYFSIIAIWIWVFMFQFWEELAVAFFGEAFRMSGHILKFSAPFLIFNLLIQINFQFLAGTGRVRDRARILATIIPINLLLNIIFISLYNVSGAALAVGISWIPLWYLSHQSTKKYHKDFQYSLLWKNLALAGLTYYMLSVSFAFLSITNVFLILSFAVLVNLIIFSWWNVWILKEMWNTIQNNRK